MFQLRFPSFHCAFNVSVTMHSIFLIVTRDLICMGSRGVLQIELDEHKESFAKEKMKYFKNYNYYNLEILNPMKSIGIYLRKKKKKSPNKLRSRLIKQKQLCKVIICEVEYKRIIHSSSHFSTNKKISNSQRNV